MSQAATAAAYSMQMYQAGYSAPPLPPGPPPGQAAGQNVAAQQQG